MTRKLITLLAALFLTLPLAHADDASKRAKIEELLQLSKANQMLDQVVDQASTAMKAATAQQSANFTPEQQKLTDQFQAHVLEIIRQSVNMDRLKPIIVQTYMDTYTEPEIDGILDFYRSPAGQAFLAKTPQLVSRTMTLMQQQMADVQPRIQKAAQEYAEQMGKAKP